jgi:hypothetical protein
MKKRTLAVNSFLAITAMAWLGQSVGQDNRRGTTPALATFEQVQYQPAEVLSLRYRAGDRGLLRAHLRDTPLPAHQTASAPTLKAGDVLQFDQIAHARTLPPTLRDQLDSPAAVVDLLIGQQAVRVLRDSREVIDLV